MISDAVLSRISKAENIGWGIVEKDYFLTLLLEGIANEKQLRSNAVFKGGTALRKVYFKNYRYSEDLDFTLKKPLAEDEIKSSLIAVFEFLKKEYNADFRLKQKYNRKWFIDLKVQFDGLRGGKNTITIDFSTDEILVDEIKNERIFNPYYEKSFSLPVYSLNEILAEKLRSLLQRTRVRDYYDVWYLLTYAKERIDQGKTKKIFYEKVKFKKLDFKDKKQFLDQEKTSQAKEYFQLKIGNQISDLPNFDKMIKELSDTPRPKGNHF